MSLHDAVYNDLTKKRHNIMFLKAILALTQNFVQNLAIFSAVWIVACNVSYVTRRLNTKYFSQ